MFPRRRRKTCKQTEIGNKRKKPFSYRPQVEWLEDRRLPALLGTFLVVNTNDGGAGSLRQAILDANNNPNAGGLGVGVGVGGGGTPPGHKPET